MGKVKIDKADRLFSLYIRTRDKWTCQRCSNRFQPPTSGLHCSHFVGRAKENTRFEPLNCDSLCHGCHQFFSSHPIEHYEWQVARKGQQTVDNLRLWGNIYKKKDRKAEAMYWEQQLAKQLKELNQWQLNQ